MEPLGKHSGLVSKTKSKREKSDDKVRESRYASKFVKKTEGDLAEARYHARMAELKSAQLEASGESLSRDLTGTSHSESIQMELSGSQQSTITEMLWVRADV